MEYVHSGEEDDERMFMPLFFYAGEPPVCRVHSGEGYRRAIRQLRQLKLRCLFFHTLMKTDGILKTLVLGDYKLSSTTLPRRGGHHLDKPGRIDRLCRVSARFNETTTAILFYHAKRKEKFDVYRTRNERLQATPYAAYFHCNDYESRLYDYEPTPLYSYRFPSYNGEGIRLSPTVRWQFLPGWTLLCQYGLTNYFDRSSIGSGTQRLAHSSKNDLSFQLRCTFRTLDCERVKTAKKLST